MMVSGRELPRPKAASLRMVVRDRKETSRFLTGQRRPPSSSLLPLPLGDEHLLARTALLGTISAHGLVGHRRPENAAELAGDGDRGDRRRLATAGQVAMAMVQADLRLPGAGERLGRDPSLVRPDARREARRVLVVPGGLDQESARVAVAGLGDRTARAPRSGGVLTDGQAEEAHQLTG